MMYKYRKALAAVLIFLMICSFETGLAGTYVLPSSVTSLDSEAFSGNTALTQIKLQSGITSIGDRCFYGCENLYKIVIPSTVTSIGTDCFTGCLDDFFIKTTPGSFAMKWARDNHVDFQANTKYRAVIIGQMYEGDEESYLGEAPKHDAEAVEACLSGLKGTPYEIHTYSDITASQILGAIDSVFGNAKDQDVSFFFYSGHGIGDDSTEYNGALCGINDTYVKVGELRKKLDQIKGRKILVIDACHSGAFISTQSGSMTRAKGVQSEDGAASFANAFISAFSAQNRAVIDDFNRYYIITAARAEESSYTASINDFEISVFTYYFTVGLGYSVSSLTSDSKNYLADSNGSGAVSIHEAYQYVKSKTSNAEQTVQVFPSNCNWMSIVRAK